MRPFAATDLLRVSEISREAFGKDFAESMFLSLHDTWPEGFLVADVAGTVSGYLAAGLPAHEWACIWMMAVESAMRSRGVGSALMDQFLRNCTLRHVRVIELEVRPDNEGAIRFYRRYRFRVVAAMDSFYGNGEDACRMLKGSRWHLHARNLRGWLRGVARRTVPRRLRRAIVRQHLTERLWPSEDRKK